MSDQERRFTVGRVELRAGENPKHTFGGYAAKFNTPSKNLGGFVEQINPGFFEKSRGDQWPDVIARYNHDNNRLLGTTAAGTLRLNTDKIGLEYEVDPPESRADVVELVQRGDVSRSSFAFESFEDDWAPSEMGFPMRTLLTGRLVDVAPVNIPAYDDTSVAIRSLAHKFEADVEEVRRMAEEHQLIRFFKRTDGKPQKMTAAMRLAQAQAIDI